MNANSISLIESKDTQYIVAFINALYNLEHLELNFEGLQDLPEEFGLFFKLAFSKQFLSSVAVRFGSMHFVIALDRRTLNKGSILSFNP